MKYGFVKVAAAVPRVKVADCNYNTEQIENLIAQAEGHGVEVICFPELSVTSYTCQDLFHQQLLLEEAETSLLKLVEFCRSLNIIAIVGAPLSFKGMLLNVAVIIHKGKILGVVPKTYLPNYNEFYEHRWFASGASLENTKLKFCGQNVLVGTHLLFEATHFTFGVEICEDLWSVVPPSSKLALAGAEIIFNLSASNDIVGKSRYVENLVEGQSARALAGYVYSGCGFGESTQDLVFAGRAYIAENGHILSSLQRFQMEDQMLINEIDVERLRMERRINTTFSAGRALLGDVEKYVTIEMDPVIIPEERFNLTRMVDPLPFIPTGRELDLRCEEILHLQAQGLAQRIVHTKAQTVVVGVSGGLDSTLALLVCVEAFDLLKLNRKGIVGITMPGFGTTGRTYSNAVNLMKSLGVSIREISIRDACIQHFHDLGQSLSDHDVTYENGQARERTQILMDAANQMGGFVVGTGDLSELALGWATYNGDHMSMYAVNVSVPKTLVRYLVEWVSMHRMDDLSRSILLDIIDTPISPELIPADENGNISQITEDLVGPYELHDFFLYYFLRYGFRPSKIFYLATRAFNGHDKRAKVYDESIIKKWLTIFCRRFFAQQFKRSCLPDGPKVGSCSWRLAHAV